jgi:DNA-binding CsgD family transcriptional regulator
MLHGRDAELAAIDGLLARARDGISGSLLLTGEPGAGKSALLAAAADRASGAGGTGGARVLRAQGVESESELAFAALHQLLLPVLDRLDRLPAPQADAVGAALGLRRAGTGDRFLVAAGVLSLLAEAAEDGPLVCVVDDLHWADEPSAAALTFAARRLMAEGVVLLAATRDPEQGRTVGATGTDTEAAHGAMPVLRIGGLAPEAAAALLAERAGGALIPPVRDALVAATGGNPLAMAELPELLSADQLAGRAELPDPLPISNGLTWAFAARAGRLPGPARRLLVLLAAADAGDLGTLLRAAAPAGLGTAELDEAQAAGLLRVAGGSVAFRHPLVRSAVYRDATIAERREAHAALAAALTDVGDADRRAWHLAAAAITPDEDAAAALERSAGRARRRVGYAAAASALSRAAEISPGRAESGRRLLAAADAAWLAGQPDRSRALLDRAARLDLPAAARAELAFAQGRLAATSGAPADGYRLLAEAAGLAAPDRPDLAAKILLEAAHIPVITGDFAPLRELARQFRAMPAGDGDHGLAELLAAAERIAAGQVGQGLTLLCEAIERLPAAADGRQRILADVSAIASGDDTAMLAVAGATVGTLRRQGLVAWLPLALQHLAAAEALTSSYQAAAADASEGLSLAAETGQSFPAAMCHGMLAWVAAVRGDDDCCQSHAEHVLGTPGQAAIRPAVGSALWALGLLDLGMGRPQQALERLHRLAVSDPPYSVLAHATGDVVEAAVRAGRPELGDAVLSGERPALARLAELTGLPWALAAAARCRALLAGQAAAAEEHFQAAVRWHATATRPFERARTELLYGEWLRRARRPRDAREHLRAALDAFAPLRAVPWAERARNELRAAGGTVGQPRDAAHRGAAHRELTPRETQIVRMVCQGATNREIAAQLFLSPRTIDYYLHKVFAKLGVRSRVELARLGDPDG